MDPWTLTGWAIFVVFSVIAALAVILLVAMLVTAVVGLVHGAKAQRQANVSNSHESLLSDLDAHHERISEHVTHILSGRRD